jgi:hypothetical protein
LDSSNNKPCISPLHWWLYIIHCVLVSKRRVSRGISNSNGGKEWNYMIAYSFHQWTEGKKICSTHNLFYHSGACATSDTWKGLVFIRTFRSSTIPGSISSTYRVTFGFFLSRFCSHSYQCWLKSYSEHVSQQAHFLQITCHRSLAQHHFLFLSCVLFSSYYTTSTSLFFYCKFAEVGSS